MADLVSLKQQGSVDQCHDTFVSLLNQLQLAKTCTLSIFTSNLRVKISQYLQLFKLKSLVEGFMLARQIKSIQSSIANKGFLTTWGTSSRPTPLLPSQAQIYKTKTQSSHVLPSSGLVASFRSTKGNRSLSSTEIDDRRRKVVLLVWSKVQCGT